MTLKFAIIGDGKIAKRHKKAIEHIGGEIIGICDPIGCSDHKSLDADFLKNVDFAVIASPTHFHYSQTKFILKNSDSKIICEKPLRLPWEPVIDDDRIFAVMQLRSLNINIPRIRIQMVRDENYMSGWKGDILKTGGFIFHLFIHYIDLAILNNCEFEGKVIRNGENIRDFGDCDLLKYDPQTLYNQMYEDIIQGGGTRPKDLFFLYWQMDRLISKYSPGLFDQAIHFYGNDRI